ncbi:head-tail connector protein [Sinirhodobacter huangdaonensis]|uniref:Phage gp6-like head-tail connector protein n=1 Tax=Paenirhodobacter huangdaonensis TaxID=2501515 RepID=A0A443LMI6_9RHOB|nr:hypothetical protein [Sinirhodobacter huangdaonensis]RWR50353.1 hypothetical protein EOW66_15230 [Sinirhodobacter huangdaonensis]
MRIVPDTGWYQPISTEAFEAALHLDDPDDPAALAELFAAAVEMVERGARRSIGPREVEFVVPFAAWGRWWFPVAPVQAVLSVEVEDEEGERVALPASAWRLVRGHDEPQLLRLGPWPAATQAIVVRARVGFDEAGRSLTLRRAAILLAKEWLDAGTSAESGIAAPKISFGVERLIRQVRYCRPKEVA